MDNRSERRYILNFSISSVAYIILGLMLIFAPEASKQMICILLGIVAIALGIFRIVWYFRKDDLSRAFHNDIPYGVLFIMAGLYLITKPDAVWNWLPVILGFAVVFDSIIKLQHAFDLKRTGFSPWWAVLAAAMITMIMGFLLILGLFTSLTLLYFFGAVLVVDGIINLITITLLALRLKKARRQAGNPPPVVQEAPDDDGTPPAPPALPE